MADAISATPRNKLLGLLSDSLGGASDWASQDNPPVRGLLNMLGVPAVTNTLNEMSYGGALGTGSGMTWKPKADTLDAAMAVAPLIGAAPALINRGASAAGRALEPAVTRLVDRTMAQGGKGAQMLTDMAQGTQSPLTVWHGSPHKFDAFDAGKIGTGEGAQAYGHGLYLAENPSVASSYQDLGKLVNFDGKLLIEAGAKGEVVGTTGSKFLDDYIHANSGNVNGVRKDLLEHSRYVKSGNPPAAKEYQQALADLRKVRDKISVENSGQLYKVDLPDEHIAKMLDWDKPLSEQHPDVQANFLKAQSGGDPLLAELLDLSPAGMQIQGMVPSAQGSAAYKTMAENIGHASASQKLREAGIPGIRYLDGGSRATGGTSNFVVFPGNEGLLNIMERNGQPVAKGLLPTPEPFVYPRQAALDTAQRNAALPVEQGGYGLAAGNTPMERAAAGGFNLEGTHTSRHGIDTNVLDSGKYAMAPFDAIGTHFGTQEAALDRFNRTVGTTEQFKGSTYPVLLDGTRPLLNKSGGVFNEEPLMMQLSEKADYGNLPVSNAAQRADIFSQHSVIPYINDVEGPGSISYIAPPQNIRSRFAAFDPFQRNSSDILAGVLPLTAMSDPDMRRGLLGQ